MRSEDVEGVRVVGDLEPAPRRLAGRRGEGDSDRVLAPELEAETARRLRIGGACDESLVLE